MVSGLHEETFDTIEANTNDEGSANGYEVCARNRAFSGQIDFSRISQIDLTGIELRDEIPASGSNIVRAMNNERK